MVIRQNRRFFSIQSTAAIMAAMGIPERSGYDSRVPYPGMAQCVKQSSSA
jgi:hypothetical protein